MQALSNIRTVMAFNGQEVTKAKYRAALALPQTFAIRQGFVSGLVMGTIYGEFSLPY
jgi:ABC transporter transmembrane region